MVHWWFTGGSLARDETGTILLKIESWRWKASTLKNPIATSLQSPPCLAGFCGTWLSWLSSAASSSPAAWIQRHGFMIRFVLVFPCFSSRCPNKKIVITTVLVPTFQTVNEPPSTNNTSSSAKPNSKTSKEATMPRKHQLQITRSKRQLPPKPAAVSLLTFTDSDH